MALKLEPGTRIVAATHNPGKARELAALLEGRFEVVAAGALGLGEPDETESTFVGNALLKARAAADASGLIALADDSGLSVRGLDGAPGVYSARWGGPDKDFAMAMRHVEERLEAAGSQDRTAFFSCALAVAWPHGPAVVVEGEVHGQLVFPGRGTRGHGYDPIFAPDGFDQTFGELDDAAKNRISHRARAFAKLTAALFLTPGGPPALGVYIHWPYCARICPYCDFNVVRDRGRTDEQARLARAILADLRAQAELAGPRRLVSIFFGGGTPSLMDPDWVDAIVEQARRLWPADGPVEITLEANPTDVETGRFSAFAAAGVGRLSLGVQALEDGALRFLGRNHNADQARRATLLARGLFPNLSVDLIYARPGQSVAAWTRELNELVALGPDHVSPYQLTIEAGTAFDRAVRRKLFNPRDPEASAQLYEATQAVLSGHGFEAYEVSNHARPGAEARHNLVYWRGQDYVGVGPGAHGRLTLAGVRTATVAPSGVEDYIGAVQAGRLEQQALSAVEAAEERLMMGLRVLEGAPLAELAPLPLARLDDLVAARLLTRTGGRIAATAAGRLVLDRVIEELVV